MRYFLTLLYVCVRLICSAWCWKGSVCVCLFARRRLLFVVVVSIGAYSSSVPILIHKLSHRKTRGQTLFTFSFQFVVLRRSAAVQETCERREGEREIETDVCRGALGLVQRK